MLTSITVENWKSFGRATLHLDPVTVLIGANASGKSNFLDALVFLNRIASGIPFDMAARGSPSLPPLRGTVEWISKSPQNRFCITVSFRLENDRYLVYSSIFLLIDGYIQIAKECIFLETNEQKTKKTIAIQINEENQTVATPEKNQECLINVGKSEANHKTSILNLFPNFSEYLKLLISSSNKYIPYYSKDESIYMLSSVEKFSTELKNIFVFQPNPRTMRNYQPLSETLEPDASNIAGVMAKLPSALEAEIERILTAYATQLPEGDIARIYAKPVGDTRTDAMLYCEERIGTTGETFLTDAKAMSDGTLHFLAVLVALLTRPEGSLLAIEEIDAGLHPSRVALLLRMVREIGRRRRIDVLMTTHNPALLDAMAEEAVPFTTVAHRDPETGDSCLTLLEDIAELPKLLGRNLVGGLSASGAIERALRGSADGRP